MTPLPIPCPRCNAKSGEPCKTINGHDTTTHTARVTGFLASRDQPSADAQARSPQPQQFTGKAA